MIICLLASIVALEKSAVSLPKLFEGNVTFSLWLPLNSSLCLLVFCSCTVMCVGVDFFVFLLGISYLRWVFSALILPITASAPFFLLLEV